MIRAGDGVWKAGKHGHVIYTSEGFCRVQWDDQTWSWEAIGGLEAA